MVIGDDEDRTIRQLERCLEAAGAVRGGACRCSRPVGGAVAYREHVSVCGVGYED
jgi:tRNA-splicing ligase RtcB (3'-phosphate/5'-hydroxy nucleic acid ligase)